ncbi:MAG TPA: NAD(P)(+) transhydrogenase (Re/Si-specific) subunit beta, partial [Candidatus Hypogeohydataceae bacterium YC38]
MEIITNLLYLVSATLFIFGLKGLSSPRTARRGNLLAMVGMFIAIVVTLLDKQILDFTYIIAGIIIGGAIGAISARRVPMTAMPQMVAIYNGFGGGASALVAMAEFLRMTNQPQVDVRVTLVLSLLVGMVTFTGSFIAFGKLQGIMRGAPVVFPFQQPLNFVLFAGAVVMGALFVLAKTSFFNAVMITLIGAVWGVLLVIPIGGADMPVVIS